MHKLKRALHKQVVRQEKKGKERKGKERKRSSPRTAPQLIWFRLSQLPETLSKNLDLKNYPQYALRNTSWLFSAFDFYGHFVDYFKHAALFFNGDYLTPRTDLRAYLNR